MRSSSASSRASSSRAISAWQKLSYARSANGGPRQSARASPNLDAAVAGVAAAQRLAPGGHTELEAVDVELARLDPQHVPGRAGLERASPVRAFRSRETATRSAFAASARSPSQSSSISRSLETTSFACSSSMPRRARCLVPPMATGRSP